MLKRTLLALPLVALLSSSLLAGCDDKKETAAKPQEKILRVGTNPTFAPFEFQGKDAELTGFDMDLIRAIGKQMGYKVELHNLAFDGLIPAIATGNIDMAIAGMTINEDRKKQVNFSVPYYTSGLIILVNPDNNEVKSLDDLKGKRIGVQLGTTGAFKAATVPDAKVVTFNNSDEQFLELSNKGVDACINDHPVVAYYLVQGGKGKMIGNVMEEESYGIALKKGNDELTKKVNDVIAELKKNGEFDKIHKKWFGA